MWWFPNQNSNPFQGFKEKFDGKKQNQSSQGKEDFTKEGQLRPFSNVYQINTQDRISNHQIKEIGVPEVIFGIS